MRRFPAASGLSRARRHCRTKGGPASKLAVWQAAGIEGRAAHGSRAHLGSANAWDGRRALGETRKTSRAGKKTHEPRKTRKSSLHPGYQSAAIRRVTCCRRAARAQSTMILSGRSILGGLALFWRRRDAVPARAERGHPLAARCPNDRACTRARSTRCRRSAAARRGHRRRAARPLRRAGSLRAGAARVRRRLPSAPPLCRSCRHARRQPAVRDRNAMTPYAGSGLSGSGPRRPGVLALRTPAHCTFAGRITMVAPIQ